MQDNQIITADNLNNIAVDLGNATFSHFTAGLPYAITELNNITKELVTAGLLDSMGQCECVLNGDNTVTVKTGIIVFSDGCKIRIEEEKVLYIADNSVKNYIFAEHSAEYDSVYLKCAAAITENECIVLAEIENGIITDKREIATAKCFIPSDDAWNRTQVITLSESFTTTEDEKEIILEVPVSGDNFTYIIFPLQEGCMSVYNIKEKQGKLYYSQDGDIKSAVTGEVLWKHDSSNNNYFNNKVLCFVELQYGKLILKAKYDFRQYSNGSETAMWELDHMFILC